MKHGFSAIALVLSSSSMAQDFHPIFSHPDESHLQVVDLVEGLDGLYFTNTCGGNACDGLYKIHPDGFLVSKVKELFPAMLTNMVHHEGLLFFSATAAGVFAGVELWASDGTEEGTYMVKDIRSGSGSSSPNDLVVYNGIVYFTASASNAQGRELWRSDGTEEGTYLLKDINPGAPSSECKDLTEFNGLLYFTAVTAEHGRELWRTDGTEEGTVLVSDIWPGSAGSTPQHLTAYNGQLIFSASASGLGIEPWRTDGTEEGTRLIKNIHPTAVMGSQAGPYHVYDGAVYFSARTPDAGGVLFTTDGTEEGTTALATLNPSGDPAMAAEFIEYKGLLYFASNHPEHGRQWWSTDGTTEGTQLAFLLSEESDAGNPGRPMIHDDMLYFLGGAALGKSLYRTDGSQESVEVLAPENGDYPGPMFESSRFVLYNDALYMSARFDGIIRLWRYGHGSMSTNDRDLGPAIGVHPNPGNGTFTLSTARDVVSGKVRIYDLSGRLRGQYAIQADRPVRAIGLGPGTYLLEVETQEGHRQILRYTAM